MTPNEKPKLIEGGLAEDERGRVSFFNDFNFENVKRFYMVENSSSDIIRAFHGHMKEAKYACVLSGKALIAAVRLTDAKNPSQEERPERFILSAEKPSILYIPPGYANGVRSLENGTRVIFFSTSSLEKSKGDDYRFPHNHWGEDVWQIKEA